MCEGKNTGKIVSYRDGLIVSDLELPHEIVTMVLLTLQGDRQFTILSTATHLYSSVGVRRLL